MFKLTEHFSLDEFLASDTAKTKGIRNAVTATEALRLSILANEMEGVRAILGNEPISITSGYRSPDLNKAVGGVSDSDHALAYACDFKHSKLSTYECCKLIAGSNLAYDQLINEFDNWVHISFNPKMRHQIMRAEKVGTKTVYKKGF